MVLNIILGIGILLSAIASIAAWINTETILKELTDMKGKLGIEQVVGKSSQEED